MASIVLGATPQRYWADCPIALRIIMAVLDGAIANIALPTIAQDLRASPALSIWTVNGYQLAVIVSLLPLASIGSFVDYRRIYLWASRCLRWPLTCARWHSLLFLTIAFETEGTDITVAFARYENERRPVRDKLNRVTERSIAWYEDMATKISFNARSG